MCYARRCCTEYTRDNLALLNAGPEQETASGGQAFLKALKRCYRNALHATKQAEANSYRNPSSILPPIMSLGKTGNGLDGTKKYKLSCRRLLFAMAGSEEAQQPESVIAQLMSVFACNGIPEILISVNGPQFSSETSQTFVREYGVVHTTSSPRYTQANGEEERAVRTAKQLFKKNEDPYLALINYRANFPWDEGSVPDCQPCQYANTRGETPGPAESSTRGGEI